MAEFDQGPGFGAGGTQNPVIGPDIASATTIAPTKRVHAVTGSVLIKNITVPYVGYQGRLSLLPTAAFTWDATGNIAVGGTAVIAKMLEFQYNPLTSKWYPSYVS